VATVVGAMVAGICVGSFGTAWPAFTIDALTFLASFGLVLGVRGHALPTAIDPTTGVVHPADHVPRRSALAELREGLGVVRRSPTLMGVLVGAGVTMLGLGAVNVLFVPLIIRELHQPATWLGAVDGAETLSMVLAAGLVGVLAARLRPTTPIVVGLAAIAVFCALLAGVSDLWQVLVLEFAAGWFVTPLNASISTVVQLATDDARRGRVAALLHSVMSLASVLSMAFAGVFGDILGVRAVFVGSGIIVGLGAVAAAMLFRMPGRTTAPVGVSPPPVDGRWREPEA
jgi:predicted MFS family arabinose efflux permease